MSFINIFKKHVEIVEERTNGMEKFEGFVIDMDNEEIETSTIMPEL